MRKTLAKFAWPIALAAVIAAAYAFSATRPVAVETALVRRGRVEEYVTEEARTQLHTERVVTADIAGNVERIVLEEGDPVTAGQLLTTIEDTELALTLDAIRGSIAEIEARLAGVDVPLPKESEIQAAEQQWKQALAVIEEAQQEKAAREAELRFAESELQRVAGLFKSGSANDREYERAQRDAETLRAALETANRRLAALEAAARVAELNRQVLLDRRQDTAYLREVYAAQIAQARARMDLTAYQITKTRVTSPINGVVLEKEYDSARYVPQGTVLLRVGDLSSIEIRADILSDEVPRVKPGQRVLLLGKAVSQPEATGKVEKVYPSGFTKISSLGVQQQRVTVLIAFDNSRLNLKPGSELDVKIAVAERDDAVLVPAEAVFATERGDAVFVISSRRAELRPVVTGLKGDDDYEVVSGLEPGDQIVLRPPTDLKPGNRLAPRPAPQ